MAAVPRNVSRGARPIGGVAGSFLLYLVELGVFLTLFVGYFLLRGLPPDRPALATANALDIIAFERAIGVFKEAAWQRAAIENDALTRAADFTYLNLHLPLLAVLGFAFFHNNVRKYRVLRNALLLSALVGVPFYILYPVTPPRLLVESGVDLGFRDTLEGLRGSKPGAMTNWYAAVPSYHFGWILLATVGVWWSWKSPWLRAGAVLFLAWMWYAIVVTANHCFLDMVLGGAIVMACLGISVAWERWTARNAGFVRRAFVHAGEMRLPF
ncbi:MAG: phosphatase PAP2 family protein [Dehalococcoidia bacterium]|nr:phosphatase PAP2 family protein [Dehalococcoidia bacterium]